MDKLIKLIKINMVRLGRDDFVTFLSEILEITSSAASYKLQGKAAFSVKDVAKLNDILSFDPQELAEALKESGV